jgi:hypothetical protein
MPVLKAPGGFRFLTYDGPFSGGVAAEPGFEIVRVTAPRYTPLAQGFDLVERTLDEAGRPPAALCAMELRVPKPLSRAGFDEFNRGYVAQHERWGLRVDGQMAPARTNVAPEIDPPAEPSLHAFCYTIESRTPRTTFVISGVPEPPGTKGGLPAFWKAIVEMIDANLAALGVGWADVTEAQIYGTRADHELFGESELLRFEELVRPGLRWFLSRPPIDDLNLEIDVRGLAGEFWLAAAR